MAGIKIRRRLLPALGDHLCGIRLSRHSPGAELLSLDFVLGQSRLSVVDLPANFQAFVIDLAAGFPFLAKKLIGLLFHLLILSLPVEALGHRNSGSPALHSRKNAEDDHQQNSACKTGDENQSTGGRIEDDRPAPRLLCGIGFLEGWGGLSWTFSHHKIPLTIQGRANAIVPSAFEQGLTAYRRRSRRLDIFENG
jgi:hypothetical protein